MQGQRVGETTCSVGLKTERIAIQPDCLSRTIVNLNGALWLAITQAAHIFGNHQIRGLHHRLGLSPDFFYPLRVVDKRIPIALQAENSLVAGYLLFAHRILFMPLQQKVDGPLSQTVIGASVQDRRHPLCYQVFVASHHIEIGTCEIALVFIRRFEHLVIVTYRSAASNLTDSTFPCRLIDFPERHIAPHRVYMDIGRIQMEQIGVHRTGFISAEPAFRETVFPIDAFPFGTSRRAPIPAGGSRGIHIPDSGAIDTGIDIFHLVTYLAVRKNRMIIYQFMQGCLEFESA